MKVERRCKSKADVKSAVVIEIIGEDKWRELIKALGGRRLTIPVKSHYANDVIKMYFNKGIKDLRFISLKAKCTTTMVKKVIENLQLEKDQTSGNSCI